MFPPATPQQSIGSPDPTDALPDIVFFQSPDGTVRVDVFLANASFERAVIETSRATEVLGRSVPLARPEASIIYKLIASRSKDLDDVEGIFEARRAAGDHLDWEFLDRWAAEWEITDRLASFADRFR